MRRLRYLLVIPIALFSCNSSNVSSTTAQPDVTKIAAQFAQVECKAIELREQRFALANDIRYTQEAIMHLGGKGDTTELSLKLQSLNTRKELLLHASLQLADQIRQRLDSLMANELTTAEARAKFNSELNKTLDRDCKCEDPVERMASIGKRSAEM